MRDNLEELNQLGLAEEIPVLLGGAALTRTYVEKDLREVYDGRLFYGRDAFEGLHTLDKLMAIKRSGTPTTRRSDRAPRRTKPAAARIGTASMLDAMLPARSPEVALDNRCSSRRSSAPAS